MSISSSSLQLSHPISLEIAEFSSYIAHCYLRSLLCESCEAESIRTTVIQIFIVWLLKAFSNHTLLCDCWKQSHFVLLTLYSYSTFRTYFAGFQLLHTLCYKNHSTVNLCSSFRRCVLVFFWNVTCFSDFITFFKTLKFIMAVYGRNRPTELKPMSLWHSTARTSLVLQTPFEL